MVKKVGRKSKYDSELLKVAVKFMAEKGLTDEQMGQELGISRSTLSKWKVDNPGFAKELKDWKLQADSEVEKSLYQRACGYSFPSKTKEIESEDGEIIVQTITKHIPPDSTSMIFWLKNRQPSEWRDKTEHEHSLDKATAAHVYSYLNKATQGNDGSGS